MRSILLALVTAGFALSGCGDNVQPGFVVETFVASNTLAAGDRVGARCAVLDYKGEPALDKDGEPLTNSTELVINFQHPDSFAKDAEGETVAGKVGTATVRCAAPDLGLLDREPEEVEIIAGAPVRVVTELAKETAIAGETVGVTCLAFDAFDNPVTGFPQSIALSPFGAGTTAGIDSVRATLVGEYEATCVVMGAASVEPDFLLVMPALPASIVGALSPERTVYAISDQVTVLAEARDEFGNRVDDATFAYSASPNVPSPSEARFQFADDGAYSLTAAVTSPTKNNIPLSVTLPVIVNTSGPTIECRRIDAPAQASESYMLQRGPSTTVVPVHVTDTFSVQSVKINGVTATFDAASGNYTAGVPVGFGMNFFDIIARDQFGKENSTTCFVLVAEFFTPESTPMNGSLGMRLGPTAIGDAQPTGLNSLNDIFYTVMGSDGLRALVDAGLKAANPISNGGCGVFACSPRINYNGNSVGWDTPSTTMALIAGGIQANVTLPNVHLTVNACGTTCCIGGSTITVRANQITATVNFSLTLQGGKMRAALNGQPNVVVGNVSLDGSGFCGFIIDIVQGFFTGTVRNAVRDALTNFINSNVAPMLDQLVSSLDINTLGTSFNVPRLDGGTLSLGFGLAFSSLDITTVRALLGIGTRFTPGTIAHNRASLGIPRRTPNPLLDPPGTSSTRPVGISLYEGILNQVLHGLWRGGFFQATLNFGNSGTAVIDGRLPAVAAISNNNTASLMLGGIAAQITIPGVINSPIPILFGGRATANVTLVGDTLSFGNFTLNELYVSFSASLTQQQRTAMENFLRQVLQDVLADAINDGLPAFPIPSFELPASVSQFGLPAGAEMGITSPVLNASGSHYALTGGFGRRN
jgi:hypothetical protein